MFFTRRVWHYPLHRLSSLVLPYIQLYENDMDNIFHEIPIRCTPGRLYSLVAPYTQLDENDNL